MRRVYGLFFFMLILLTANGCSSEGTLHPQSIGLYQAYGHTTSISNGKLTMYWDQRERAFAVASGRRLFLQDGRLPGAGDKVDIVQLADRHGDGQGLQIVSNNGDITVLALYKETPFVIIQRTLAARGETARSVGSISTVQATPTIGLPASQIEVLGCDGLTDAAQARVGHCFLAMADPKTRSGIVAGWTTHDSGSGIVSLQPQDQQVRLSARSEYGRLQIEPQEMVMGETLAIGFFDDVLDGLEQYADLIAKANGVTLKPAPGGYCTWYSNPHGGASDEKAMAELAVFCEKELTRFGFEVMQIDDKWQISSRDFTTYKPDGPYPSGMKHTAEVIRKAGMTAGIWYIPFGWDHTRGLFADHPDWFVKRRDTGQPYEVHWAGTCLDMTHPEARRFLEDVIARMSKEWDYKYMKIDGLWTGLAAKITYPRPEYQPDGLGDAVFHDPSATNLEAYRSGLRLVRQSAGKDVFILGCNIAQNMRTLGASFGLVDGMRVGRDIGARWDHILPCVDMGSRLYFLHSRVWHNDPDCLMLREPLTLDQARAWGSWIALTGQLNLVSEWLPGLPPERLEIVKRTMPNHGLCARPIDLFSSDRPQVWQLTDTSGNTRRDVIGLFNWDDQNSRTVSVAVAELDLPESPRGKYVGFDYWSNLFIPLFTDTLEMEIPAGSCRIIAVRPVLDHPFLLSTRRHITQGIVDVIEETWNPETDCLHGISRVIGNDPYELRVIVPEGRQVKEFITDPKTARQTSMKQEESGVRIFFQTSRNQQIEWNILFQQNRDEP
ncbi:MAG: alpha-galactosidase [Sedimentisphaerales bacterium]|nr:alpha-galactosidase [Sedimentisphaerales bacterium]